MEPVRIGVIGCGTIGGKHMEAASAAEEIELTAVADLDAERARQRGEAFGVERVYDDASALLADERVEAVVLALTAGARAPVAEEAFARGKHVLLEKPAARSADELRRLIAARGELVAGSCSARLTFNEPCRVAADAVARGELGPVRSIRCRGLVPAGPPKEQTPPPWRVSRAQNGGGYLVNWGVYDLNFLFEVAGWSLSPRVALAGAWPVAPHLAAGRVHPESDGECHVSALVRCDGGEVLTIERGEFVAGRRDLAWEIAGERGALAMGMIPVGEGPAVTLYRTSPEQGVTEEPLLEAYGEDVQHAMPVRDLAAAIREGRSPCASLERALVIQEVTDAIYRSAETGEAARIEL